MEKVLFLLFTESTSTNKVVYMRCMFNMFRKICWTDWSESRFKNSKIGTEFHRIIKRHKVKDIFYLRLKTGLIILIQVRTIKIKTKIVSCTFIFIKHIFRTRFFLDSSYDVNTFLFIFEIIYCLKLGNCLQITLQNLSRKLITFKKFLRLEK